MVESGQSRFSDVEFPEIGEYKPLSLLAIVAVVLSVLGSIAALQPWLVAFPAVAAVVSLFAVVSSSRSESRAGGKWLAACGLLLSLFLVAFATARTYSRHQQLRDIGRPQAETWLRLVLEGRVKEAHQLSLEESLRDKGDLDQIYAVGAAEAGVAMELLHSGSIAPGIEALSQAPKPRRDDLKKFVALPDVARLLKLTPAARLTFVSDALILDSTSKTTVSETFSVVDNTGAEDPFDITLVLERHDVGDHFAWHVSLE